eukprot:10676930-Prorocentrum_lima.AAC.1
MQEMQAALSTLPVEALRQTIVKAAEGKLSPIEFHQMNFSLEAHFDELNAGRMRSGRPAIEYQHLTPTFAGTFVDASQIRLASLTE